MNSDKIILDLCGGTGSWSKPYAEAGYDVRVITLPEHDVRTYIPPRGVYGILAAPPLYGSFGQRCEVVGAEGREGTARCACSCGCLSQDHRHVEAVVVLESGESGRKVAEVPRRPEVDLQSVRLRRPVHEEDSAVGALQSSREESCRADEGEYAAPAPAVRGQGHAAVYHASWVRKGVLRGE